MGAFIGRTEAELSDMGRHQAEALKEYLRDAEVDAILSSPRLRARATVSPLAAAHGIPVRTVPGFAEMEYGRWEGLHWEEILRLDRDFANRWQSDPAALAIPGGESVQEFEARVAAALGETLVEFRGRCVVLAAHAGVSRAILAGILGIPFLEAFAFAQDYGNLNAAAWDEAGRGQVALVNFVPGPRSASAGE